MALSMVGSGRWMVSSQTGAGWAACSPSPDGCTCVSVLLGGEAFVSIRLLSWFDVPPCHLLPIPLSDPERCGSLLEISLADAS